MGRKESNQTNKYLGLELQWSLSWNLHINSQEGQQKAF